MTNSDPSDGSRFSLLRRAVDIGLISDAAAARLLREVAGEDSIIDALLDSGLASQLDIIRLVQQMDSDNTPPDDAASPPPNHGDGHASGVATPGIDGQSQPSSAEPHVLPGLPARYELQGCIGAGGMGRVYKAFDHELQRTVAIKVGAEQRFRRALSDMMRREREVLAQLNDPGIVSVFDSGPLDDGSPFFVMQFVEGRGLKEFVVEQRLDVNRIVRLAKQIAESLGRAHLLRIVHRDLKPQNILVTPAGRPVLLDFGLAKPTDLTAASTSGATGFSYDTVVDGQIVGTPAYMSPEQAAGQPVDARTDVYSFGLMLYELLAGEHPRRVARSSASSDRDDDAGPTSPPPLRQVRRDVPRDLAALVNRCLQTDPRQRYGDAIEVAQELDRFLAGWPVATFATGRPLYRLQRMLQRNPVTSAAFSAALLLLLTSVGIWNYHLNSQLESTAQRLKEREEQRERDLQREAEAARRNQLAATSSARRYQQERQPQLAEEKLFEVKRQRNEDWELARLRLELSAPQVVIHDLHEFEIFCSLTSSDGRRLATTGQDGRVILLDLLKGQRRELRTGVWPDRLSRWVAFHPFNIRNDNDPLEPRYPEAFSSLCWLRDGQVLAGVSWQPPDQITHRPDRSAAIEWYRGRLLAWDLDAGTEQVVWEHSRPLVASAAAPDGTILLADVDGELFLKPPDDAPQPIATTDSPQPVSDIAAIADWGWCIAREDRRLKFLDAAGAIVSEWDVEAPILDVDVRLLESGDTAQIAVARAASSAIIVRVDRQLNPRFDKRIDIPATREVAVGLETHAVRFDPHRERLYIGDNAGRIVAWDLHADRLEFAFAAETRGRTLPESIAWLPRAARRAVSGIEIDAGPDKLWSVGQDGYVKSFDIQPRDFVTHIALLAGALVAFDHIRPELLWAAAGNELMLIDTRSGVATDDRTVASKTIVGGTGISSLAVAQADGLVATTSGRTIQFWRQTAGRIASAQAGVEHSANLRRVSLRPDGKVVAGYDEQNVVMLWDTVTGRTLRSVSMADDQDPEQNYVGLVQFNADGTRLAVAGLRHYVHIFDAATLEQLEVPYIIDGTVATGLAWDPVNATRLYAVGNRGRIMSNIERIASDGEKHGHTTSVACSPDGRRVVRAFKTGRVGLSQPDGGDDLFELHSPHVAAAGAALVDVTFDPTGRRLALLHDDGLLAIWETQLSQDRIEPALVATSRKWSLETYELPVAPTAKIVSTRPLVDDQGRLFLLYFVVEPDEPPSAEARCTLHIARMQGGRLIIRELADLGDLDGRRQVECAGSIALAFSGNTLYCVHRKPRRPDIDPYEGQPLLHQLHADSLQDREPPSALGKPKNWGFGMSLFVAPNRDLLLTHFAFDGYYFGLFRRHEGRWTHHRIGRQGDGKSAGAVFDRHAHVHAVFSAGRHNRDRSLLTYLHVVDETQPYQPDGAPAQVRELIDSSASNLYQALTVDEHNDPVVLYMRERRDGVYELVLSRREDEGWRRELIFSDSAGLEISNLTSDASGRPTVACAHRRHGQPVLDLLTRTPSGWQAEPVAPIDPTFAPGKPYASTGVLFLLDASTSHPVIARLTLDHRLHVYRAEQ